MYKTWKKSDDLLQYECSVSSKEIAVWEHCENPHEINEELRCTLDDFLKQDKDTAQRIKETIVDWFGKPGLEEVLTYIKNN